jgi:riboflavin kinase/FMN adenylyltransferase
MDVLICVPFTREFAALTPRQFVEDVLLRKVGMRTIVVGGDYSFGRNREGNLGMLRTFGELFDFEVILADWIKTEKALSGRISSTRIREMVMEGRVDEVQPLLGRYYQIRGEVAHGRNRGGKLLGFPTANINLQDELSPKSGVYAVTVECMDRMYLGVANIGYSPTFDDHIFTVEVHILDFNEDVYGKRIRVNFVKRIRDEIRFASLQELSDAIRADVETARGILPKLD